MLTKETQVYRQIVTLDDGARVLLRMLVPDDRQALLDLYATASAEDRDCMRHDVRDPEVINTWIEALDYERVLPLVAVAGYRIVGNATLHFKEGPDQHRGEVRIFLARDLRRRGLGTHMLQVLIEFARRRNLYLLEVEIRADQGSALRAVQALGFKALCTLPDYFLKPNGELADVVLLLMPLRGKNGEF
jgi:RimJ/RimL family protein N-acetyltransferase